MPGVVHDDGVFFTGFPAQIGAQRAFEVHQRRLLVQQEGRLFLRNADVLGEVFVKGERVFVRIAERLDRAILWDADDDGPDLPAVDDAGHMQCPGRREIVAVDCGHHNMVLALDKRQTFGEFQIRGQFRRAGFDSDSPLLARGDQLAVEANLDPRNSLFAGRRSGQRNAFKTYLQSVGRGGQRNYGRRMLI